MTRWSQYEKRNPTISFKEIVDDWHNEFPFLAQYSPTLLYQRVGPLLIGLNIVRRAFDYYNVYFVISPLWRKDEKFLGKPELYGNIDVLIPFWQHRQIFETLVERAKKEYDNILSPKIEFGNLLIYLDKVIKMFKFGKGAIILSQILEMELALAVYVGREDWTKEIWDKIKLPGMVADGWLEKLHTYIKEREDLTRCVESNCRHPRIAKLSIGEFVSVGQYPPQKNWEDRIIAFFKKQY